MTVINVGDESKSDSEHPKDSPEFRSQNSERNEPLEKSR